MPLKVLTIRFIVSGLIGIGMWYFKGWSAGDAKLFWLLSLPFQIEGISPISIFNETFIFLINIFLPVIPVLFFSLILDSVKRLRFNNLDLKNHIKTLFQSIGVAILMMIISRVIYLNFFSHIPQGKFNLISMLLLFFVMSTLTKVFTEKKMYIPGAALFVINIVMLYFNTKEKMIYQIFSAGVLAIVVILIRIFYESVLKYLDLEVISISKLRKGDLLSKEFIHRYELDKGEISEELGEFFVDGLTSDQVEKIRKYLEERNVDYIERQRTFSFSIYIVIGYAFTYFTGFDNMILFIKNFLTRLI